MATPIEILAGKLRKAEKALEEIAYWNEDLEDEYGDPGARAQRCLESL